MENGVCGLARERGYCFITHIEERWILKRLKGSQGYWKQVVPVLALVGLLAAFIPGNCLAADYDYIKIFPENIGVFTSVGTQQFVAFGYPSSGSPVNITDKVEWQSSNTSLVTIDQNGLATVASGITYGQVRVTCTYPKAGSAQPGVNFLLLKQ